MEKKLIKNNRSATDEKSDRCIWMTAGVISFKLCPLNFDCERCDFDRVMRAQAKPTGLKARVKKHASFDRPSTETTAIPDESEETFFTYSVGEMDEHVYVHPTHLWAKREYGHTWKIGVDNLMAYILPPLVKVEMYPPEHQIIQEEVFGRISTEAGTVFITSPLSGQIVKINPRLSREPELLQTDPWGEGWLAMIEWVQDGSELEKLYAGTQTVRFLKEEAQNLKLLLKFRGIPANPIGPTLPDGGSKINFLHQILPPKLCLHLVRELIVSGKEIW